MLHVVVAALLISAAPDRPEEGNKRAASQLIEEGNALFAKSQFKAALARFESAYATYPSPKIFLNLANARVALGDIAQGADDYQRFIDLSGLDPTSPLIVQAQRALDQLSPRLGTIRFLGEAYGAEVYVDEKLIGKMPIKSARVLAGEHRIVATAVGRDPFRQTISVEAQDEVRVTIDFGVPLTVAPPAPVEQPAPAVPWAWIGIGAAVLAAIGVGIAVAASGSGDPLPPDELGLSSFSEWMKP